MSNKVDRGNSQSRRRFLWRFFSAITFLAVVSLWVPGGMALRITPVNGGSPLRILPMKANERFTIRYYHSVENAPIWETHSVDADGNIYIEEERYLKFGAGMGKMPGVGRMEMRGPYEVITDMHMPVGDFILRIGSPGVDHTVIWRGTRTNLSAIAPHTAVQFQVRPIRLANRIWQNRHGRIRVRRNEG